MRLDKFLKVSRIIKRRTVAKLVCDNKKIKINGKVVKSSSAVKELSIIKCCFASLSVIYIAYYFS